VSPEAPSLARRTANPNFSIATIAAPGAGATAFSRSARDDLPARGTPRALSLGWTRAARGHVTETRHTKEIEP